MLRSLRLANHRSFADEQELLLMPARAADGPVVPVAAIYGANASGKSNLIGALMFMYTAVCDSFARWDVDGGIPREPFRLNLETRIQPSYFVVDLLIDDVRYDYGFAVDDDRVLEEWLYAYPNKRKSVVFERTGDDLKFGTAFDPGKSGREVLGKLSRPNSLFLSAAVRVDWQPLKPVYEWFRRSLRIQRHGMVRPAAMLALRMQRLMDSDPVNRARVRALLKAADVGIKDIEVVETADLTHSRIASVDLRIRQAQDDLGSRTGPEAVRLSRIMEELERERARLLRRSPDLELRFFHGEEGESFSLREESAGTQSWLNLLPTVLEVLDAGTVLVVDEIDTSLHPLLTAQLIGLFRNPETNPDNAQLIFTTHDTSLLGTMISRDVLGRDQVWFVEKGEDQRSHLFPLTDFKPRKDQNTERRYLGGSYGAVPVLDEQDFVDAVLGR